MLKSNAIRIVHIITDLEIGGAEIMLANLLSAMNRSRFKPEVIALGERGPLALRIEALDIPVRVLGMERGSASPTDLIRLTRWLRESRPHLIQSWMYHANLAGGLAAKFAGGIPVIWSIHASHLEPTTTRRRTTWMIGLSGKLSGWLPTRIVYCSEVSYRLHESLGYADDRKLIIPNGFDIDVFIPDPGVRAAVREELGVSEETPLIGMVARFDPQKDHENFFNAAALLHVKIPEAEFVLCGPGITADNTVMRSWMDQFDLAGHCHLLGQRGDVERILASLDVASTASSYGEAFPMVVGEAMACGVPCVVTNIGDSSIIIGDTDRTVPPRDPEALADAWAEILGQDAASRRRLGDAARERIIELYSLGQVTNLYEELYEQIGT